jgi:hypothetical protein
VWITNPFNVANFWAGMTAAMVPINQYTIINQTMFWMVQIAGGAAPVPNSPYLYMALPEGRTMAGGVLGCTSYLNDGGLAQEGLITTGNATLIAVTKVSGAPFTSAAPGLYCYFTAIISIN